MTIRQTYGLLDYFGDIGGLVDFFFYLGTIVLTPVWQFIYSNHLLTKVFRASKERKASDVSINSTESLKEDFRTQPKISKISIWTYFFCCLSDKRKKFDSRLKSAERQLE